MIELKSPNKQDQQSKFTEAFLCYYDSLCYFSYSYLRDGDVVEDIVQDVFVDFWNKIGTINFEDNWKSLLYTMTKNKCIDYLRKARIESESVEKAFSALDGYVQELLLKQEEELHFKQLQLEILSGINSMPEQRRKVFVMSRMEGLKNKEIAAQLNISIKTVEKHMSMALLDMKDYLQKRDLLSAFIALSALSDVLKRL